MRNVVLTAAVVLGLTTAPTFAQADKAHEKAGGKQMSDQTFVTKAAAGGIAEVELGKLAQEKGTSDQVKSFGQRMVTDHSKANDELKTLAQNKNITLPTEMDAHDKAAHDRLAKLSGAAFDRAYMQAMLTDHRKVVNEFRHESTAGQDPDIKSFAAKTLPTIEEHVKLAQEANRAVGTSGTLTKSPKKSPKL
jgi:putative membrane protein